MGFAWLTLILSTYFLGSFPSAYIAGKFLAKSDIRETGDGNVGAANAYRELGAIPGIIVALIDFGKGVGAALIADFFIGTTESMMIAGVLAVAGHNWPLFLQFRGGRGAATSLGVLAMLMPLSISALAPLALLIAYLSKSIFMGFLALYSPLWILALLLDLSGLMIFYAVALPWLVCVGHFIGITRRRHT